MDEKQNKTITGKTMKNNEKIKLNMYNNKYLQCTKTNIYSIQQQIYTTTGPTIIKTPKTLFESSYT
uniref:Ovule protein n=1 Tax=Romanomermis culicivorax TaxID=13658 RepID=A0A915J954_ROMCU